jgi:hypothetical protein
MKELTREKLHESRGIKCGEREGLRLNNKE